MQHKKIFINLLKSAIESLYKVLDEDFYLTVYSHGSGGLFLSYDHSELFSFKDLSGFYEKLDDYDSPSSLPEEERLVFFQNGTPMKHGHDYVFEEPYKIVLTGSKNEKNMGSYSDLKQDVKKATKDLQDILYRNIYDDVIGKLYKFAALHADSPSTSATITFNCNGSGSVDLINYKGKSSVRVFEFSDREDFVEGITKEYILPEYGEVFYHVPNGSTHLDTLMFIGLNPIDQEEGVFLNRSRRMTPTSMVKLNAKNLFRSNEQEEALCLIIENSKAKAPELFDNKKSLFR